MIGQEVSNEPDVPIRFGIVLLPNFTLTAFSGFVDLLRLASDEGDMSRPVRCSWTVVGENVLPVRASCGIQVSPWETFEKAQPFDYVVVVGGLLHSGPTASEATIGFIRRAADSSATVVGICTGIFALMRADIMAGYRTCVSWYHYWDLLERFPQATEASLVADRLFVIDRCRITCAGGSASIDVAAAILLRHFDAGIVQKALRILLVDDAQKGNAPQPQPLSSKPAVNPTIRKAIQLMEQHIAKPLTLFDLAQRLDISVRRLERMFQAEVGVPPVAYARQMRMRMAAWLLTGSEKTLADVADSCGFSDASHLSREFKKYFGVRPAPYRGAQTTERNQERSQQTTID